MRPEQVERVRLAWRHISQRTPDPVRDAAGLGQLREGREYDLRLPEPADGSVEDPLIDDLILKPERWHPGGTSFQR